MPGPKDALLVPLTEVHADSLELLEALLEAKGVLEMWEVPLSRSDVTVVGDGDAVMVGVKVAAAVAVTHADTEKVPQGEAEVDCVRAAMEGDPVAHRVAADVRDTSGEEESVCDAVVVSETERDHVPVGDSEGEPDTEGDALAEPEGGGDSVVRTLKVCETDTVCECAGVCDAHWEVVSDKEVVTEGVRDGDPDTDCEALIVPLMEGVPEGQSEGLADGERLPVKESVVVAQLDTGETLRKPDGVRVAEGQLLAVAAGEVEARALSDTVCDGEPLGLRDGEPEALAALLDEIPVKEVFEVTEGEEEGAAEVLPDELSEAPVGERLTLGLRELDEQRVEEGETEGDADKEGEALKQPVDDTVGDNVADALKEARDAEALPVALTHERMEGVAIPTTVCADEALRLFTGAVALGDKDALFEGMLALPLAERVPVPLAHMLMLAEVDAQGEDEVEALSLRLPDVEPLRLPSSDPVGVKVAVRLLEAQLVAHAERVLSLRDDEGETDPVEARLGVPVEGALAEALFEARAEFEVEAEGEIEEVVVPLFDGLPVAEREKKALPVPLLLGRGDAELLVDPVRAAVAVMEEEEVMEGEPDWVCVLAAVAEVQGDPEREGRALPELVGLARVDVVPLAEPVAKPVVVAEDETLGVKVAMAVPEGGAEALEEPVAKLAVDDALGHGVAVPLSVEDANAVLEVEPVALKEGDSTGDIDTEPHMEAVPVTRPVFDTVSVARGLSLTLPE